MNCNKSLYLYLHPWIIMISTDTRYQWILNVSTVTEVSPLRNHLNTVSSHLGEMDTWFS